jgi:hypothetical protein
MANAGDRAQPPNQDTGRVKTIRKARRVGFRCTLTFSLDDIEGEATVTNLSPAGCRAESSTNMAVGLEFNAYIHLPNHSTPVEVERAVVRWVSGETFGLHFLLFFPSQRERLRAVLEKVK